MRASALLATVWLAGCAAGNSSAPPELDPCEPLVVVPATGAGASERASIAEAVELWRARGGVAVTLDEVDGAPRVPVSFRDAPLMFLGVYETGGIVINRGLDDQTARTIVVAHELGHVFGLHHVDDPSSVMRPGNLTVAPGPVDAAALAALWGSCAAGGGP